MRSAGEIAGVYRVGRELGRGAAGVVYEALDVRTGARVALKRLAAGAGNDVRWREVDILRRLRHANVVQLLGCVRADDALYIVMELADCGSLAAAIKRFGPLQEPLAAVYTAQILRGLAFLAQQGVVHRDLKGANVLVNSNGLVKLSDFGIATIATSEAGAGAAADTEFAGSPFWLAPEQVAETGGGTQKSDVWSLGCTVIEMLTGAPPWSPLSAMVRAARRRRVARGARDARALLAHLAPPAPPPRPRFTTSSQTRAGRRCRRPFRPRSSISSRAASRENPRSAPRPRSCSATPSSPRTWRRPPRPRTWQRPAAAWGSAAAAAAAAAEAAAAAAAATAPTAGAAPPARASARAPW